MEFVLSRFSHFYIAIAYLIFTFCGACTPSFCELTQNFSKTRTPQGGGRGRGRIGGVSELWSCEISCGGGGGGSELWSSERVWL